MAYPIQADDGNYYMYDETTGLDMSKPVNPDGSPIGEATTPTAPATYKYTAGSNGTGLGGTASEWTNVATGQNMPAGFQPSATDTALYPLPNGTYAEQNSPEHQQAMQTYQDSQSLWGDVGPGILNSLAFVGGINGLESLGLLGGTNAGLAGTATETLGADGGMFGLPTEAGGVSGATAASASTAPYLEQLANLGGESGSELTGNAIASGALNSPAALTTAGLSGAEATGALVAPLVETSPLATLNAPPASEFVGPPEQLDMPPNELRDIASRAQVGDSPPIPNETPLYQYPPYGEPGGPVGPPDPLPGTGPTIPPLGTTPEIVPTTPVIPGDLGAAPAVPGITPGVPMPTETPGGPGYDPTSITIPGAPGVGPTPSVPGTGPVTPTVPPGVATSHVC